MGLWPEAPVRPHVPVISTHSPECMGVYWAAAGRPAPVSTALSVAGLTFFPLVIREPFLVRKTWAYNGASLSGNTEIAVYDDAYQRIVTSGAVAQAGTNQIQEFDVTDTWLTPGRYYLVWASSSGTATFFMTSAQSTSEGGAMGLIGSISFSPPLPADLSGAALANADFIMHCGIASRSLVA